MITKVIQIDGSDHAIMSNGDVRKVATAYGKSTDTKPKDGYFNGDRFYEMDTKKVFMFDGQTETWIEQ